MHVEALLPTKQPSISRYPLFPPLLMKGISMPMLANQFSSDPGRKPPPNPWWLFYQPLHREEGKWGRAPKELPGRPFLPVSRTFRLASLRVMRCFHYSLATDSILSLILILVKWDSLLTDMAVQYREGSMYSKNPPPPPLQLKLQISLLRILTFFSYAKS